MTKDQMTALQPGDIIRHRESADAVVVTANYGSHAIAVRTCYVSQPAEWILIPKPNSRG